VNVKARVLHEESRLSPALSGSELRRLAARLPAAAADAGRAALGTLSRAAARVSAGLGEGGAQSTRAARQARRLGDVYGRYHEMVR